MCNSFLVGSRPDGRSGHARPRPLRSANQLDSGKNSAAMVQIRRIGNAASDDGHDPMPATGVSMPVTSLHDVTGRLMVVTRFEGKEPIVDRKRRRLAERRRVVGLSQERFAEVVGVDRSTTARWERGETTPQPWHRPRLAEALKVSVEEIDELLAASSGTNEGSLLTNVTPGVEAGSLSGWRDPDFVEGEDGEVNRRDVFAISGAVVAATVLPLPAAEAISKIADGLTSFDAQDHSDQVGSHDMAQTAVRAKGSYQAGHYRQVLDELPRLLGMARVAADLGHEGQRAAADLYQTACSVLLKIGESGLALLAADKSTTAAHRCGDPVVIGASTRALAHALASNGHPGRAVATALAGARHLERATRLSTPSALAVYGALLLRAAILAAGREDRATAVTVLNEAQAAAGRLDGEDNRWGTYFCSQNVHLHRLSTAVRLGDAGQAVEYASQINPALIKLRERRASYYVDLTRAFTQWGKTDKAYEALSAAERTAPQEIVLRPAIRQVVVELQRRCPPNLQQPLRQLAERIGASA